jgi:ureidoacrylate peracid hydrolase
MHKTELHPDVIGHIKARRGGRMHVHDRLDPAKTALVVIDMQVAFLKPGLPSEVPVARAIVPNVNRLAQALRAAGGTVVWVYSTFTDAALTEWSSFFGGIYAAGHGNKVLDQLKEGAEGHPLWPELDVRDGDLRVSKDRFSAFLPGASDIEEQLRARGIENVAITGTLTNVCCESSARDAMMRNFNVIMVSDGNATYSDAIHNASLTSMSISFADIMTTDEVIERLTPARSAAAE